MLVSKGRCGKNHEAVPQQGRGLELPWAPWVCLCREKSLFSSSFLRLMLVLWLVLDVALQNHLPEWLKLRFSHGREGTLMPPASSCWKVEQQLCPQPHSSHCALFHRALAEWPGGFLLPWQWQWHPDQDSQQQLPPAEHPRAPGAQGDGQLLADQRLLHSADGAR